MNIDFVSDYYKFVCSRVNNLIKDGFKFTKPNDNNNEEVVKEYLNWITWIPTVQPRQIRYPSNFICPKKLENGFLKLIEAITKGENLYPWMSRRIYDKPQFVDNCQQILNIYHFHLGTVIEKQQIQGTNDLALFYFTEDEAYFIDFCDHEIFKNVEKLNKIFNKLYETYPELKPKLTGFPYFGTEKTIDLSFEDSYELEKEGISTLYRYDENQYYFAAGFGLTTAKTSVKSTMLYTNTINFITLQEISFKKVYKPKIGSNKNITFLPEFLPNIVIKIDEKKYLFEDDKLFELCDENR